MESFLLFYCAFSTLFCAGICITSSEIEDRNFATVVGLIIGSALFGWALVPIFLGSLLGEADNWFKKKGE